MVNDETVAEAVEVTASAEQQSEQLAGPNLRILSVDDLISVVDTDEEVIDVPEWGGAVRIRSFSKNEQLQYRREAKDENGEIDNDKLEMLMLVHGIVEPKLTAEHVGVMRQKRAMTIDRVLKRILVLSGLDAKSIAEAEKSFRR